jgi:hypothetical protein
MERRARVRIGLQGKRVFSGGGCNGENVGLVRFGEDGRAAKTTVY